MLGYDTETEQCAHGLRATFSTLSHHEHDQEDNKLWDSDVAELCLAHLNDSGVKSIYKKHGPLALIRPRAKLFQHWAEWCVLVG